MAKAVISSITVSHSEKRKAIDQYQPNDYYASMKVDFPETLDMEKISDIKTLITSANSALYLVKSVVRTSQTRDGISPKIAAEITEKAEIVNGSVTALGKIAPGQEKNFYLAELGIKLESPTDSAPPAKSNRKLQEVH